MVGRAPPLEFAVALSLQPRWGHCDASGQAHLQPSLTTAHGACLHLRANTSEARARWTRTGSAVAVTVSRYQTPAGVDINKKVAAHNNVIVKPGSMSTR